jgi:hypothetical protein
MRCERVQFYYEDYSRMSLPVSTLGRVEEHLAGCPVCRAYFEQNDLIASLLHENSEVAHPGPQYFDDLAQRVLNRLDEMPVGGAAVEDIAPVAPLGSWRRPMWWMGAAAAAGLMVVGFLPQMRTPDVQLAQRLANPATAPADAPALPAVREAPGAVAVMLANHLISGVDPGGTTLDKSVAHATRSRADIESLIRSRLELPLTNPEPGDAQNPEAQPGGSSETSTIQTVSLRPGGERPNAVPEEVLKQLEAIKTDITDQGDDALIENLRRFDQTIQRLSAENAALAEMPMIQQARHYLKGDEALTAGQPKEAWLSFHRVITLDGKSPLALRANLQMADLYYSEWADFPQAREYYKRCQSSAAAKSLTGTEREHVARQLDRLERHAATQWESLHLLHSIRRGQWPEAVTALRRLTTIDGTRDLLPEAARAVVDRMKTSPAPTVETTNEVYNLLAKQAQVEQNGEIRAWLDLALGDLLIDQLNNSGQAGVYYQQAIEAAGDSGAAKAASEKLYNLQERNLKRNLNDLVRK